MRRMYGDQRHISVLRAEIESNDVEYLSDWKVRDDVRRRYSTTATSPHFRPASTTEPSTTAVSQDSRPITPYVEDQNHTTTTVVQTTTEAATDTTSTTVPCTSTEQIETSTAEPPTATTVEESTTARAQTEKVQLFQDTKEEQPAETSSSSSSSVPMGVVKLRGVNACPVKEEVVAPFWANNTRGEVLALLNLYPFEQYVHWEKCTFEHKQMFCREGCRCEQQYRLHRLLAYDPNNECRGIFSDWFKFPSCCVCRCYDLPVEFQITSRSPRTQSPMWNLYNSAPPDWYRLANAG